MKFELIKDADGLEMYGDCPCLPIDYSEEQGERFVGTLEDAVILKEHLVPGIDTAVENLLDIGDVDYFDCEKCRLICLWIEEKMQGDLEERLRELYGVLLLFMKKAIELKTGVVIGL